MKVQVVNDQNRVVTTDDQNVVVVQGGNSVTVADVGPQGPAGTGAEGYILQAYDTTDQTAASTTTAYPIKLGTVDISDGITVANNGSGDPTRITFANDGDYNIQFSIQFQNSSADDHLINVWFRKNGVDIADSNSQASIPKKHGSDSGALILALNLIVSAGSSDYVELYWQTESTAVSIQALPAGTTPTTPATPSVIVTATVNRYLEVGPAGPGVATGGTTGQVLTKASATNYDTTWATPAMGFIKTQSVIAGSAIVEITGAFSSTYRNYMIVFDSLTGSATPEIRMTLGSTTSGYYYYGYLAIPTYTAASVGINLASWFIGYASKASDNYGSGGTMTIYNPNVATQTNLTMNTAGILGGQSAAGTLLGTTQYTSFKFTASTGTFSAGNISIYGINA